MTGSLKINLEITSSDSAVPLGLEVWVDTDCVISVDHVESTVKVCHELSDADAEHELRVVLKNKTPEHTQIDADGNIVQDAVLTIDRVEFDDIEISDVFVKLSQYQHSFNGTGEPTVGQCYKTLGCNGTVSLKFNTPFYLWLLETM